MFKTPSFETIHDQKREERVAGFLEGLWGYVATNYRSVMALIIG